MAIHPYSLFMGKGRIGCAASAMEDPQVYLIALRERWAPYLQKRFEELIAEAELIDSSPAQMMARSILGDYTEGSGGPERWIGDHLDLLRGKLAKLAASEHDPDTAIALLSDMEPRQSISMLEELRDKEALSQLRAHYGSALAGLLFSSGNYKAARQELQAQVDSPETPDNWRALAKAKLESLGARSGPQGALARLVPAEIWEEDGVLRSYCESLEHAHLASTEGRLAASELVKEMSERGYHRGACQLAGHLLEAQKEGSAARDSDERLYSAVLRAAGRLDEAAEVQRMLAERPGRESSRDVELYQLSEIYDQAGMRGEAIEVARLRRDLASDSEVGPAQVELARLMAAEGMYEEALQDIDDNSERLTVPVGSVKELVLRAALGSQSDRDVRSDIRESMAEQLIDAGRPIQAIEVLEDDLSEPGLSPDRARARTDAISSLEAKLDD